MSNSHTRMSSQLEQLEGLHAKDVLLTAALERRLRSVQEALAAEKAAREAAERQLADAKGCAEDALRVRDDECAAHEQTRLRAELAEGERDEWCDKYADERAAHVLTRAEWDKLCDLVGLRDTEIGGLRADLATAQARVEELQEENDGMCGLLNALGDQNRAAESALASARTALKQASAEHPHWPGWEPLIAALSTTPAESPAIAAAERAVLDAMSRVPNWVLEEMTVPDDPQDARPYYVALGGAELARRAAARGTEEP